MSWVSRIPRDEFDTFKDHTFSRKINGLSQDAPSLLRLLEPGGRLSRWFVGKMKRMASNGAMARAEPFMKFRLIIRR